MNHSRLRLIAACAAVATVSTTASAGLKVGNVRMNTRPSGPAGALYAFPLRSPPVVGFQPFVAATLTDARGPNDFDFYAVPAVNLIGNRISSSATPYSYYATLDSGSALHILSNADYVASGIEAAGLDGTEAITVVGASGQEELLISDTLGIFVTGTQNLTSTNPPIPNTSSLVGQYRTSVLSAEAGSSIPSLIGTPMMAQFAVNIRNSQTKRISTPAGFVRSPSVEFVPGGSGVTHQFKMDLELLDSGGAYTAEPFYFPSNFEEVRDNPSAPTNWTYPFARVDLNNAGREITQEQFLFDTGAQVSVLSTSVADRLGYDVEVDEPDFFVDVLGVGGSRQVGGFFIERLELNVLGGTAVFEDVPVLVLDIADPRDANGSVPGIIGMNLFNDRDLSIDMTGIAPFVRFSNALTPEWNKNAAGTWSDNSNWVLGSPDGPDVQANFLSAITTARTINVDSDFTIGSMKFDNANSYTLAGAGRLTFATLGRPSKIEVAQGSHTVASPLSFDVAMNLNVAAASTLTLSGDTASPESAVRKLGTGQLRLKNARYASLAIDAGSVQLLPSTNGSDWSQVESLTISSGASLDVTNRRLIVDYEGASPLQTVRTDLAAGRIVSSGAASSMAVGYAEAAALGVTSFGGTAVDADAILLRLTLKGDANLNGGVNFADLVLLAQNYNQSGTWINGDFNYDATVNFADLVALAQNYNRNASLAAPMSADASFAGDWALAQTMVPEPASMMAIAGMICLAGRRRR